jgi:hypothetical protein
MANRYWVGGTGTWNNSSTTNWSATSGGASGASVPTAVDDVFFDQAGTYTVNLSPTTADLNCRNLTVSTGTVTLAHNSTVYDFNVRGNFTILASTVCTGNSNNGFVVFNSTAGTTTTFTTNGASIPWTMQFTATTTSTIQLGSNLTCTSSITLGTNGRLNTTASNYAITCASFNAGAVAANLLTLNSSTLTITSTSFTALNSTSASAASATIVLSGTQPSFSGAGGTYGTVNFTSTTNGGNAFQISGANTFTNLIFGPVAATFRRIYSFSADQTVTGTFTVNSGGTAGYGRIFIRSSSPGTARTITAAAVSLTDADFQDVTAAGAAAPWSGTRLGDCLGNTSITFAAARTVYWNSTSGAAWASTNWSDSVGGTSSVDFFPLAQDTAAFTTRPNAGSSITQTDSSNNYAVKTIDFSSRSLTLTFSQPKLQVFGSFAMASSVSFTSTSEIVLSSRSSETLDVSVGTFSSNLRVYTPTGTYTPTGNFLIAGQFSLIGGTFDCSAYTFQAGGLDFSTTSIYQPALARTFNASGSSINLTGTGSSVLDFGSATVLVTYNAPRVFNLTNSGSSSRTINASGAILASEANSITVNITAGTGTLSIAASVTHYLRDVNFTGFSGALSIGSSAIVNVYGNWTNSTTMSVTATTATIVFAATSGVKTITSSGDALDYNITFNGVGGSWQLQDNFTTGATKTTTLTSGTIDLQSYTFSTGLFSSSVATARTIAFGTGAITCTGTGTVWTTATTTNLTTSGTQVVNVTSVGSTAISVLPGVLSQVNSISFNFTGGTYALTFLNTLSYSARSVDFTGFAGTWGATAAVTIYGDLKLSTGMTLTASTSILTFGSTSATVRKITSNGKTMDFPVTFSGVGGAWQLQDNMTLGATRTTTLTNGALDLQSFTLSTGIFSSANSNARSIAFGTGNITCVSTGTVFTTATATNLTTSGTQVVNISNPTATATTVSVGAMSEANAISFNFTTGTYALTFLSSTSGVENVNFTGFSGSWAVTTSGGTIYGDLTLSATMTISATGQSFVFGSTSVTQRQITSNGKTIDLGVTFNGIGGSWRFQDAFTLGSTRTLTLTAGGIDSNGVAVSTGSFSSAGSSIRSISFGSSTWTVLGANWTVSGSNFSTSGAGTISMTSALAKTFAGGGFSFPTLNNGGAGALTISGSNTFANLTNTVQPTTFTFTSGTTTTFTNFSISGTAGNLVTVGSTSASQSILQKSSGWNVGLNSTNGGNNTGLFFAGTTVNYLSISYIRGIVTGPSPGNFLVFF